MSHKHSQNNVVKSASAADLCIKIVFFQSLEKIRTIVYGFFVPLFLSHWRQFCINIRTEQHMYSSVVEVFSQLQLSVGIRRKYVDKQTNIIIKSSGSILTTLNS